LKGSGRDVLQSNIRQLSAGQTT